MKTGRQGAPHGSRPSTTEIRLGAPRPLPLHLSTLAMIATSSYAASPFLKKGWLPWSPQTRDAAMALVQRLDQLDQSTPGHHRADDQFARAVLDQGQARYRDFITGVNRYRAHPARRTMPDLAPVWREGSSALLDGAPDAPTDAPVILVVPSLTNTGDIFDFMPGRSLIGDLAGQGFHPYLMEWGAPAETELAFSVDDYVAGRLCRAFDFLRAGAGAAGVAVIGHRLGGLMALALAVLRAEQVSALALLATPFEFHGDGMARVDAARAVVGSAPVGVAPPLVSAVAVQTFFATLDPLSVPNTFRAFAAMDPRSAAARDFVLLQDWINDGLALAGPVGQTLFGEWYGDNRPARGQWRVGGRVIDPAQVRAPTLLMVPKTDPTVPPGSAAALALALPKVKLRHVKAGSLEMLAGPRAVTSLYRPLGRWLGTAV